MITDLTALALARMQFAFTMAFHIVFPAFSIGLASFLAVLEGLWLWKKNQVYKDLFNFWKKIFAVAFGMGVVSGIVMSYEFGTNWSVFSDKAGPVIGPLMGYEVFSAFFLEAGFLGVMLFGEKRVGAGLHYLATCMVAVGTLISATWILAVNSWMQTPAGYSINTNGQFVPENWMEIIFNPSFPYRFVHMVLAAYLTTAFVVGGVGAWHLLKDNKSPAARKMFSMAMWMAVLVAPLQIAAGDIHGLNTLEYQPAKIAAMEGDYETEKGSALILFGVPDDQAEITRYQIAIPNLGALILTHRLDGEIKGLKSFPKDQRPPAAIVFWSFRIMVGIGFMMLAIGLWSLVRRWQGVALYRDRWLHWASLVMLPSGFVAVLAGWTTTEVGRQPYTVYGLLTTAHSVSPVAAPAIGASFLAFIIVYFFVYAAGVFYLMRLAKRPPDGANSDLEQRPMHAAGINPGPVMAAGE
jgi:cytochrome bd ubiquinol oxidase subunit I